MKNIIKISLLGLLAIGVFSSCGKNDHKKNFIEKAFGIKMEMVYVEGGEFQMGGTAEQGSDAFIDERPIRNVKLNPYYIGKYEVTREQWIAVMYDTVVHYSKEFKDIPVFAVRFPMWHGMEVKNIEKMIFHTLLGKRNPTSWVSMI